MIDDVLFGTDIESFEQGYAARETLFEIYLAAHCGEGDGFDLLTYAGALCQFVNDFCLDERRVHIYADKPSVTTIHVIALERDIDTFFA